MCSGLCIACMICPALVKGQHTDPDKSVLMRAGVKMDHPETYAGSSDLEEFEVFVVHRMQPTCTYNAPKPEQKTVQVKDSSTKLSHQQKPLLRPPEREGNSMNITCYECGQAGHIRTNCPRLTKVRTAAIREDGTEDPEMDPQEDDEALPPDKEGEGDSSEHQDE